MEDNERIIREFIEAWSRLDSKELAAYFAEDGVYHNMPTEPVVGRTNIEKFIAGFSASWTETTWDILNIVSSGDIVIAERLDRTRAGEKSVIRHRRCAGRVRVGRSSRQRLIKSDGM